MKTKPVCSILSSFLVQPVKVIGLICALSLPAGAGESPSWPFVPLGEVVPPLGIVAGHPIDRFILAKLQPWQLSLAPEATRLQLVRRLYFDLLGLPPTPAEVHDFLTDVRCDAYERLVDRLLADPRYGERWARRWLDLARYADTAGYEGDPDLPHAWRYRDYVIDAMNHDKPYDLFIREQLAGDEFEPIMGAGDLPDVPSERLVALTFLRLAPFTEPRGDETRHEMLSEMTSTTSSVFLGLTMGCAKCHDHKYDAIPTVDFYRLQAFFATVQIPRPEPGDAYQIGGSIDAPFYRIGEAARVAAYEHQLETEGARANQELSAVRHSISKSVGLNPLGTTEWEKEIERLVEARDSRISEQDRQQFDFWNTRARFIPQHRKRLQPVAMSLRHSYGPPYEPGVPTTRVMIRGEYDNPGEPVEPGFPSVLEGNSNPASIRLDPFKRWPTRSRRMALADWIASPDNPLTARVMANRVWGWHFGQGIVPTPSDFGQLSGGASHPELLDWLAQKFIESGWSLKSLHRLIVTSQTYRQTSLYRSSKAAEADPDNRLLWRFPRQRMEAEVVRDTVLAVSGRLNLESHGLPIFPPLPDDLDRAVRYGDSKWDTQHGNAGRRRSIYIYQQRTLSMPLMQTFDALVCDESQPLRRASVTPLQALALFNSEFANEESRAFADRVRQATDAGLERQIELACELAWGRLPDEIERHQLLELCRADEPSLNVLERICRILINTNEFLYLD